MVDVAGQFALAGDSLEPLLLSIRTPRRNPRVAVLDGPEVVAADGGRPVLSILLLERGDIERDVVHHRADGAPLPDFLHILQLVQAVFGAGGEVLERAESGPRLMSD